MSQQEEYFAVLTAIGEAKDAAAKAGGKPLKFVTMDIGDGNGIVPIPNPAQTQLVNRVFQTQLNEVELDPVNTSQVIIEGIIPEQIGNFWVREVGVRDDDGDLVAVGNCAPSYKPVMAQGSARHQRIRLILVVSSADTVQLQIDPSLVMATREFAQGIVIQGFNNLAAPDGSKLAGFQQAGANAANRNAEAKLRELVSITDFSGADPSGVGVSSAAVQSACNAVNTPYVPAGQFQVDTRRINGLWGPGELTIGGRRIRLPFKPRRDNLISAVLAKLARCSWGLGTMVLVGDSISEGYHVQAIQRSWFNMLEKMLNVLSTAGKGSEPEVTNLSDPQRYGLTYAGNYANGTAGPVQRSLILQPGATVKFTGNYQYVDVVYQQKPGGGTLTMDCNGQAFKVLNTSGAATPDVCSFPSAVGPQTGNDVFTFTASGAPVELTGIWRLADTHKPSMFASRCALSAKSTQLFSQDAVIDSVLRHARSLNADSTPIIFVAIGVNNANTGVADAGTTPADYEQQLGKMFARYINSGAYVIAIGTIQPSTAWGVVHDNYPAIAAAQRKVCEQYGVPLIAMDVFDWVGDGTVLSDELHPNDRGNELMLDLVLDFLASPAFDLAGHTQRSRLSRYTPTLVWRDSNQVAATAGVANVRYTRNGPVCRVIGNLTQINPSGNPANGPLSITLPVPSQTTMRSSGMVGAANGFTVIGKAWSMQTVGDGTSLALLRTLDAETGKYAEVTAVQPNAMIDFDITYITQD